MLIRGKTTTASSADLAQAGSAVPSDVNTLLSSIRADLSKLDGKIDKLAMQMKLLIILALVAIAMFSPNLAELVRVAR